MLELEEEQKDKVKEILDAKRFELIEDELTRYEDLTKRQLASATRFAREQIVLRIKEVKGTSPLEDLLATEEDSGDVGEAA